MGQQAPNQFFTADISTLDPEISSVIGDELRRDRFRVALIHLASVSLDVDAGHGPHRVTSVTRGPVVAKGAMKTISEFDLAGVLHIITHTAYGAIGPAE